MLQEIHGFPYQNRDVGELDSISTNLAELRSHVVPVLATEAFQRDTRYSYWQWLEWYTSNTFDRKTMNDANRIWCDKIFWFEMTDRTWLKVKNARTKGEVTRIIRPAFRAWKKEKYGHATLADTFLKVPMSNLTKLIEAWGKYVDSDEYKQHKLDHAAKHLRTHPVSTLPDGSSRSTHAPEDRPLTGRGSLQHDQLRNLRQLRKQAVKGKADPQTMRSFHSGELDAELERLTVAHGTGRYWDSPGKEVNLRPYAFQDFLEKD